MRKFWLVVLSLLFALCTFFYFVPEKHLKKTTKEFAREAEISPVLASFVLHTKLGRKIAFLAVKKELKKQLKEY